MTDNRGQAYSVEGILSALLIVSAMVLGMSAVNIAPFTGDDSRSGDELRTEVNDVLAMAEERGALSEAVTCLGGPDSETPHPAVISTSEEATELGTLLNNTLNSSMNYNMYVDYGDPDATGITSETVVIGSEQQPAGTSVTVTRQVLLFDSDPVWEMDTDQGECVEHSNAPTLGDVSPIVIYMPDVDENEELYNVAQVRVVAWR